MDTLSSTDRFIQRHYTQFFTPDQFVFIHQNGLCLVGISQNHPIVVGTKTVEKVNFNVSNHDYSTIQVVGKRKKGAPKVRQQTNLVQLNCTDGSKYVLKCQVNGTLIETNPNIVAQPELVSKWPTTKGYIAIIQCNQKERDRIEQEYSNTLQRPDTTATRENEEPTGASEELKRKREGEAPEEEPHTKKIKNI